MNNRCERALSEVVFASMEVAFFSVVCGDGAMKPMKKLLIAWPCLIRLNNSELHPRDLQSGIHIHAAELIDIDELVHRNRIQMSLIHPTKLTELGQHSLVGSVNTSSNYITFAFH